MLGSPAVVLPAAGAARAGTGGGFGADCVVATFGASSGCGGTFTACPQSHLISLPT
jgi:hypothetical protein